MRKAYAKNHVPDLTVPALAKAELARGNYKFVVDDLAGVTLSNPTAVADLKTTVAGAFAAVGMASDAALAIKAALAASPAFSPAKLFQARMIAEQGDYDGALRQIEALLAGDGRYSEAARVKGDVLLYGKNDVKGALAAYEQAVEIAPDDLMAHTALISTLTASGQTDKALDKFKTLKTRFPQNPQTAYFDAEFAYRRKDYKAAREALQLVLLRMPFSLRALQLAGANELALNSLKQAETHLSKALQMAPASVNVRLLLARTQLRSGEPTKGLVTLKPLLESVPQVPAALAMAADAQLQSGNAKEAEELYARALRTSPADITLATGRARAMLAKGDSDAALAELSRIASSETGNIEADLLLAATHLRRNDWHAAMKDIDALDRKRPNSAFVSTLRAEMLIRHKDGKQARAQFEAALRIDPVYFPAVKGLAGLDMSEGQPDAARSRFEGVLKTHPKHVPSLMGLARVLAYSGAADEEIVKAIQSAKAADPAETGPHMMLTEQYLLMKDGKAALAAAADLLTLAPESPAVLDLVGQAQLAGGAREQAMTTFGKLAALQPKSPMPQFRLASVYLDRKETDAAITSYRRALQIAPDFVPAQVALISTALAAHRIDQALEVARAERQRRPNSAHGYALEGDIQVTRKDWPAAIAAFSAAVGKADASSDVALRLYSSLQTAGRAADAEASVRQWLKGHPTDAGFLFNLARWVETRGDTVAAEARYRESLKLQPDGASTLNNLAAVMLVNKSPGALVFAERAAALYPESPPILDTLSLCLLAEGKVDRALEVSKKALAKLGGKVPPQYTLTHAKILAKIGQKDQAVQELNKLTALGAKFSDQREATDLLATLKH
ncbi:MAG: PEP-CTERM system TPR-repeat protein PrsT [Ideonella sp.]|nr:PEP-CTERM system TPR-repeat protein PrsT [Ideonella sp.]